MAKSVAEKLVVGVGVFGLLVLGFRAIRLLWTGLALTRNKSPKGEEEHLAK